MVYDIPLLGRAVRCVESIVDAYIQRQSYHTRVEHKFYE